MSAKRITFAADTGGTFTDLVVQETGERPRFYKRSTTPSDPVVGLLNAVKAVSDDVNEPVASLLARSDLFVFGTTRATNAVVTGSTAKTALLVSQGHTDTLLFREGGGRRSLFDYSQEYPQPFIPRGLTYEVRERISATGDVIVALDEAKLVALLQQLREQDIEAIAVALLWSPINDSHEQRVGELIRQHLPGMPFTLSSQLNPSLREYRRTSSAAIDAALKPLMSQFFRNLDTGLKNEGFTGRLLIMTSSGGVLDAAAVAETPIHSIGSGPAGAPVAARYFAELDNMGKTAIVTDAGGTTYDVSLLSNGQIPKTRETMVGKDGAYITGFPSVDARSVGAGGGSIAWVDSGGMLHIGPMSAGADPGPACYGRGGDKPTVTDACLVLGYIDPDYFMGGTMQVNIDLARQAIMHDVAEPLGLDLYDAADAIVELATEHMAMAIESITLNQGIDPENSFTIAGGGGAGLYCGRVARRLNSWPVLIPEASAAMSATGAMLSDLQASFMVTDLVRTERFDYDKVGAIMADLKARCQEFISDSGVEQSAATIDFYVEARYPQQVWEISVALDVDTFSSEADVAKMEQLFHQQHEQLFAIRDDDSPIEVVSWGVNVRCSLRGDEQMPSPSAPGNRSGSQSRAVYYFGKGQLDTQVLQAQDLETGKTYPGPLLVESPVTTLVIDTASSIQRSASGSIIVTPSQ